MSYETYRVVGTNTGLEYASVSMGMTKEDVKAYLLNEVVDQVLCKDYFPKELDELKVELYFGQSDDGEAVWLG